ncbi:hypothetical protein GvMRE_Ic2gS471 [endosymbiont GvMRE of Glomus versiforme]|nr:hypothetical protein GvMRE_Ic2gS461 [endosymbiont GvMRE of Glomus versiforme]RHZ36214.1 hypothetical protein GvMRE_Ic2gS471 [endosymbiont GvMRE of Glomus versiforme]
MRLGVGPKGGANWKKYELAEDFFHFFIHKKPTGVRKIFLLKLIWN